ncbi:hypothetical protein F511_35476 [Dorcoceras hygrometricum]|uniref:WRKY19-like zinc finger domain-containing protein n=1 Tax=Dorcoceras hygrometricum TaxID=472368 RepID=A0A2Z7APL7_9LAMI|nr:hypothetical protein F511_35476 [Dorcoceras hygrometricum]
MDSRLHNLSSAANPTPIMFKSLLNSIQIGGDRTEVVCEADITLKLVSSSFESSFSSVKGVKRKWSLVDGLADQQIEGSLDLNLCNSSSSSDSKESTVTACTPVSSAKESEEESSMDLDLNFTLHLGGEKSSAPEKSGSYNFKSLDKLPTVDLQLSLSSVPARSDIADSQPSSSAVREVAKMVATTGGLNADERSIGTPPFLLAVNMEDLNYPNQSLVGTKQKLVSRDLSSSIMIAPKSSVTCTSGISQSLQRNSNTKQCKIEGCLKGARGASGRCIAHGGGRRCQRPDCCKGAEGRTAFCKAHGGGRRCEFLGCTKSAEGRTDFCIAHGGGRRCIGDNCTRAARGKSGLCIRHGGGKRCQKENCTKSAEGLSGFCISHGGGRRCQHPECDKGAQGSTLFCKGHGGGKRCTHPGCEKGAEGSTSFCKGHGGGKRCSFQGDGPCPKSVHGGTLFCVAHGGGKRCAVTECTRSARGRTNFCVRHGGGKRCKIVGCGKSAQGSTDFCKSHGEGKRCSWGRLNSEFGVGEVPCDLFIKGKTGLCAAHCALVRDKRVHGGATVPTVQDSKAHPAKLKRVITIDHTSADITMMENSIMTSNLSLDCFGFPSTPPSVASYQLSSAAEGRVHGGNLVAAYASNLGFNFLSSRDITGPSETAKSSITHRT